MRATAKPPVTFWIAAALALPWNLFGVVMFRQNLAMTPDAIAARSDWTFVPFGIGIGNGNGTVAGVPGAMALLLLRRKAVPLLLLSGLGIGVLFAAI